MVNRGGITFAFRAEDETGASAEQVARAYLIAREVFGLSGVRGRGRGAGQPGADRGPDPALPGVPPAARPRGALVHPEPAGPGRHRGRGRAVPRHRAATCSRSCPSCWSGAERRRLERRAKELVKLGAPDELAHRTAALLDAFSLLDVTEIAGETGLAGDRGRAGLLHPLRALRRRRDARPDHRAAARGPLGRAGPGLAADRPLRRAGVADHRRPPDRPRTATRTSGSPSGRRPTPTRWPGPGTPSRRWPSWRAAASRPSRSRCAACAPSSAAAPPRSLTGQRHARARLTGSRSRRTLALCADACRPRAGPDRACRSPDAEWLHLLVGDWQLLSDLSFADLVLWLPEDDGRRLGGRRARAAGHRADGVLRGPGRHPGRARAAGADRHGVRRGPDPARARPGVERRRRARSARRPSRSCATAGRSRC